MLEPPFVRPKLADGLGGANNAYEQERFSGHVAPLHRANYCACDDCPGVKSSPNTDQQRAQHELAPPRTRHLSKRLLKRLLRELSFYSDSEDAIVLKSLKNPPPKKRRKNIQSGSSYIGVSRNGPKW